MFDKLLLTGGALLALGVCTSCATTTTEEKPEPREQAVQEVRKTGKEIYYQATKTQDAKKRAELLKEAFDALQKEADRNNLESALYLAYMYDLGQGVKQDGISVIFVSSEMPEVLGIADRIIVMCDGRITGEMMIEDATQEKILELATRFESKLGKAQAEA